ncbi:peroxiredoxin Q [Clavulina sp. PMI_390]|nr:peroxiredoxin Q [Clavulina sp. PMI_390]
MVAAKDLVGKAAPKITLPDANGEPYTLDPAAATKPIILFFYPAAFTYGCTKEACSFRDALANKPLYSGSSTQSGVQIIGVSPDTVEKQKSFVDQYKLTYPVLSDAKGEASAAYGVGSGLFGLTAGRTTFIIEKGIVQDVHEGVLNYAAHEKFVSSWLEVRTTGAGSF